MLVHLLNGKQSGKNSAVGSCSVFLGEYLVETNPYQPFSEERTAIPEAVPQPMKSWWRYVPAVFLGILGLLLIIVSVVSAAAFTFIHPGFPSQDDSARQVSFFAFELVLFLACAVGGWLWIVSARWFWRGWRKRGMNFFVLGGFLHILWLALEVLVQPA